MYLGHARLAGQDGPDTPGLPPLLAPSRAEVEKQLDYVVNPRVTALAVLAPLALPFALLVAPVVVVDPSVAVAHSFC